MDTNNCVTVYSPSDVTNTLIPKNELEGQLEVLAKERFLSEVEKPDYKSEFSQEY